MKLQFQTFLHIVNGQWGEWNTVGECSKTCGDGWQQWRRKCDAPAPKGNGNHCTGNDNNETICNIKKCPGMNSEYDL